MIFMATFFVDLFSSEISETTFDAIFDRVATSKDFMTIRENIMMFLQVHLSSLPSGLSASQTKLITTRRKRSIKILQSMEVLTYSHEGNGKKGRHNDDYDNFDD